LVEWLAANLLVDRADDGQQMDWITAALPPASASWSLAG
jgi:hypothetical protein